MRNLMLSTLLVVVSLAITLLLGEWVTRWAMGDRIVLFPRYHTVAEYGDYRIRRFRPNSSFWHTSVDGRWRFQTDSRGLRNQREYSYNKPPGVLRVLSLGDSHTAGYEVNQWETFSAVTERLLVEAGLQAQVINAGISGFSTAEQLVYLQNEGIRFKPDVVVLGFYANDFEDNLKAGLFRLTDGELKVVKREHLPGVRIQDFIYSFRLVRWLSENSYLYSFGFNTAYQLAKKALARRARASVVTEYAIPVKQVSDYGQELGASLVGAIYEFCAGNNISLVIVDIPIRSEEHEVVSSIPTRLVHRFADNSNALLASEKVLAGTLASGQRLHVAHGHRHISAASHQAIAKAIVEEITAKMSMSRRN